jgi:hypothetical protein
LRTIPMVALNFDLASGQHRRQDSVDELAVRVLDLNQTNALLYFRCRERVKL